MKTLLALALLALGPLLSLGAEERVTLNGTWAFTIDPARAQQPASTWDRLAVPGNWDTHNAYAQHVGRGWYQREFTLPSTWRERRIRLHFDAVYETAEVLLNGQSLGRHEGGYTPFEFDVTDRVRRDAPNVLTVIADNTYHRGAWWPWGGISRPVTLVANHDVRIVWQHVRAVPDLTTGTASVEIEYLLDNAATEARSVQLEASIAPATNATTTATLTVPAQGMAKTTVRLALAAPEVRRWDFDHPNLYTLTTHARSAGETVDERTDRFGIRKVDVRADGLYLNGERVRLVGFNRVHDHRTYGNTEPDFLVRLDVDRMKRYGGNFMRIMHAPSAPNLLDYLDEKGVLIFAEIPVWGEKDPNMIPDNPRTRQWLREMVARDYNHPSIIGWSVGNELLEHYDYVKSMIEFTRRDLDASRLISYVSYSGARPQYTPGNDPISVADLILHNSYGPNPGQIVDALAQKWPGRPVFLSEFGARQFGDTLDARIPGLDERWETLAGKPQVIGTSLWTFNDYRSNYRGSAPGELRSWGIVDLWRRDKAAARDIARLHSPFRSVRIHDGRVRLEPRGADEFPSYALRGYTLVWEWTTADGVNQGGGVAKLPDLLPGAAAHEVTLVGQPSSPPATTLTVRVVSPLGYLVHETGSATPAEPAPPPTVTRDSAPIIFHAEPFDGGFMLGYSTQPDDAAFTVEYGTAKGVYPQSLTVPQKGALAVEGLENGRTYYARLRREGSDGTRSAWSNEIAVTPDGGLLPPAPARVRVLRGDDVTAVCFSPVAKAIAYRVRWDGPAAGERLVNGSELAAVLLDGSAANAGSFAVTALNAVGESPPVTVRVNPSPAK